MSAAQLSGVLELNSIHCNEARPWQFVVGGSDESVRVYDQRRADDGVRACGSASASIAQPVRLPPASRSPVNVVNRMFRLCISLPLPTRG